MLFFRKATREARAVIAAFHAWSAGTGFRHPEDVLVHAAYAALASEALRRHRVATTAALPPRMQRELAMVLVLVHEDRPSFDRALVMAGIPVDVVAMLRTRADRRPELRERTRLALRAALAEARTQRLAARSAARAATAVAAMIPFEDPIDEFLLAPEPGRLAA
jgi:hypothetical protein